MSTSPLFADRILNITVTGPLVRLELGSLRAPTDASDKPQLVAADTLVMPLEGFLASLRMIDTMVKKMIADGVIKARPAADEAAASGVSSARS
jgi:hypothetical protein